MLLDRYSTGFTWPGYIRSFSIIAHWFAIPNGVPSSSLVHAHRPSIRFVANIRSPMYRFPSIDIRSSPVNQSIIRPFGHHSGVISVFAHQPISSDEYQFPSISIHYRTSSQHGSSRVLRARHLSHNARSAFAFSPCSQWRYNHLLNGRYHQHEPTTTLRLNASSTLRPTKYTRRLRILANPRSVRLSSLQPVAMHPLDANTMAKAISTEPKNCWLLLAISLEPLPASLHQPA